jgi:hypothetical protein
MTAQCRPHGASEVGASSASFALPPRPRQPQTRPRGSLGRARNRCLGLHQVDASGANHDVIDVPCKKWIPSTTYLPVRASCGGPWRSTALYRELAEQSPSSSSCVWFVPSGAMNQIQQPPVSAIRTVGTMSPIGAPTLKNSPLSMKWWQRSDQPCIFCDRKCALLTIAYTPTLRHAAGPQGDTT